MKNIFIYVFMLAVTCLFVTSCSLVFTSSQIKTHYQGANNFEQGGNLIVAPKEEINKITITGYKPIQSDLGEEAVIDESTKSANQQQSVIPIVSSNSEGQSKDVVSENKSEAISDNGNSQLVISEPQIPQNTNQQVYYSGGSGHSRGLPYWFIVACAIFIPPLAVALVYGIVDKFWICLALTLCFWLPGMIYALIQVLR